MACATTASSDKALAKVQPEAARAWSLDTMERVASRFALSALFLDTKDKDPEIAAAKALAKILAGHELGFGPFCSMANVYIVNGRAALSAVMMASAIKKSGRYNYRVKTHTEQECVIEFFEKALDGGSWESVGVSSFTIADAKKAGLTSNQTWTKYPRNMLFARALSNGARWYCADVFGGNTPYTPDEIQPDMELDEEGKPVNIIGAADVPRKRQRGGRKATLSPASQSAAANPEPQDADFTPLPGGKPSREELDALIAELDVDVTKFLAHYGKDSLDELLGEEVAQAVDLLQKRKSQRKTTVLPDVIQV